MTELERVTQDLQGREATHFEDSKGKKWLLVAINGPSLPLGRLALDREEASALVTTLQRFLETGSFAAPEPGERDCALCGSL